MSSTGTIEDRLAIQDLLNRYCDAVNQRDPEVWGSTWAKNSVWSLPVVPGMEEVKGRDTIVAAWVKAMEHFPFVFMAGTIGQIWFEGNNRARMRSYTAEVAETANGTIRPRGQYDDVVIKEDGQWLFERRIFNPIHGE